MARSSRRNSVRRRLAIALGLALSVGVSVVDLSAHRRDEFLQAARLAIEPARLRIELDLTPGIAVADAIIGDIDRDHDGRLSSDEQRDYAADTIRALQVDVDGVRLPLQLEVSRFSGAQAMRDGEGIIRLDASAPIQPLSSGDHQLLFRNTHHPERSVYLANALVPESQRVAVRAQRRDRDQRELTIEYSLSAAAPGVTDVWLVAGLAAGVLLSGLVVRTWRRVPGASPRTSTISPS